MKKARIGLVLLAGAVVLSGCSASESDPTDTPEPLPEVSIEGLSGLTADLDYAAGTAVLPTDQYDNNTPEFVARMLHAFAVRADDCLIERGYSGVSETVDWNSYSRDEDRTFGRWSIDYASRYGAGQAIEAGPPTVDVVALGPELSAAYGECNDRAKSELQPEIDFAQGANIVVAIKWSAFEDAQTSDAGRAALDEWRTCARDAGVVLDSTSQLPVDQYSAQDKASEIAAYVAYAECAKSTGAVQTLFDLRLRYETALLAAKEAQVAEFVSERKKVLQRLDEVIAGG